MKNRLISSLLTLLRKISSKRSAWIFLAGVIAASVVWVLILRDLWEPETETKIVYVDRATPPRVIRPFVPDRKYVYLPIRDTVHIRIPVPRDLRVGGVLDVRFPPERRRNRLYLTYWNPDSSSYIRDVFTLPERKWAVWFDVGMGYEHGAYVDTRVSLRRSRLVGYFVYQHRKVGPQYGFGIRYRFLHFGH